MFINVQFSIVFNYIGSKAYLELESVVWGRKSQHCWLGNWLLIAVTTHAGCILLLCLAGYLIPDESDKTSIFEISIKPIDDEKFLFNDLLYFTPQINEMYWACS